MALAPASGRRWLWSAPGCGVLVNALTDGRATALRLLHRERFGRAPTQLIQRSMARALRQSRLDFRYVLRHMVGKGLVASSETAAGGVMQLTPAGQQAAKAAAATASKKRRRR